MELIEVSAAVAAENLCKTGVPFITCPPDFFGELFATKTGYHRLFIEFIRGRQFGLGRVAQRFSTKAKSTMIFTTLSRKIQPETKSLKKIFEEKKIN